jgi:hypothetical protein
VIADLLYGWAELEDALPGYIKARDYYDGTFKETFASRAIEDLLGDTGDEYKMNLAATAVDVLADRLELVKVVAPGNEAITTWIAQAWEANDLDVHYADLILKTCEYGDAYMMVWPVTPTGEEEQTSSLVDDALVNAGAEFRVHDPCNTRIIYDDEDERRKRFAIKRWQVKLPNEQNPRWRVDLHYPAGVEHWISRRDQPPDQESGWEAWYDPETGSDFEDNPFGEIPFFHHRTALPYGIPVHQRGYGAQNAITKMHITQLASSEAQGFRQRYGLVDPDAVLDSASDSPDYLADDEANALSTDGPRDLQGGKSSNIRTGPGTMQMLQGLSDVGTFDEANPDVFMDPAEDYIGALAVLVRTPLYDLQPSSQPVSGESRRIAEHPLVKRAAKLQKMLRAPVVETWQFALKATEREVVKLRVSWSPPYAADGIDDWQMVQSKQTAGVPQHLTLTEAGYEADDVTRWLDDDPEQLSLAKRVELFGVVAAAAQNLGLAGLLGGMPMGPGGQGFSGGGMGTRSASGAPALPAPPPPDPKFKAMILELLDTITTATTEQP